MIELETFEAWWGQAPSEDPHGYNLAKDAFYAGYEAALGKVSKLTEKWRDEFTLHADMDQCYAIHANAVHACAEELEQAV